MNVTRLPQPPALAAANSGRKLPHAELRGNSAMSPGENSHSFDSRSMQQFADDLSGPRRVVRPVHGEAAIAWSLRAFMGNR
jgi:hypothetical protein